MQLGGEIFSGRRIWWNPFETYSYLKAEFSEKKLVTNLKKHLGEITLGSNDLKTGLCIVAKRVDSNSPWFFINHPRGKFYEFNKNIPLWKLLRASSAAPTYFIPQSIDIGNGEIGAFVDGGVSMANNPALSLFMIATMKSFPFNWIAGEDKLTLISVGTGHTEYHKKPKQINKAWLLSWVRSVPEMLMQDASWQNQVLLQWLSKSPTAVHIDLEMENLKDEFLFEKPLLNYLRFNTSLSEGTLNQLELGKIFIMKDSINLSKMSNAANRFLLYDIGKNAAEKEVSYKYF
ncbi:patatin-like phospholipase/acyl hydrolase [Chryseobacterium sp. JUb7]|nr:patatin-like phospholipase/acyl hydrolase [Chryseobacterium sp. JUb7]